MAAKLSVQSQSGFVALTQEAKRKGYLIHEDLINLLPSDFVDPNQMENIIDRLNEMGIRVYEVPPDENELLLEESDSEEESGSEEEDSDEFEDEDSR